MDTRINAAMRKLTGTEEGPAQREEDGRLTARRTGGLSMKGRDDLA